MRIKLSRRIQNIIKIAVVSALAAAAIFTIAAICSVDVGLTVYYGGRKIGTVQSPAAFEAIVENVREDAQATTYGDVPFLTGFTYVYAEGSEKTELTDTDTIRALLCDELREGYRAAYGLYIDGQLLAANVDTSVINLALSNARLKAQGKDDAEITLNAEISVASLYYPDSVLKAENEIEDLLAVSAPELYTAMTAQEPGFDITYSEDEFAYLSPNPDGSFTILAEGDGILDFKVTEQSENSVTYQFTVKETISYKTVYEQTDELYVGSYEKKSDGENGEKKTTYSVTYENGVEVSREAISEQITSEAVNKVVYEGTKAKPLTVTTGTFIVPIDEGCYKISSTYGWRELYGEANFHRGLDFAAAYGTPIHAADGGLVTEVGYNDSLGYHVMILHDNGYTTVYAHMSKTLAVKGTRVAQGETIGKVGATGIATGDHLHFEVRIGDTRYDPQDFLPQ